MAGAENIQNLKYHVQDIDTIIENKMKNEDDFESVMKEILTASSHEIANAIFANFVSSGHTQKQIEVINKIKNILLSKEYQSIEDALPNVHDAMFNDIHPLSDAFDGLDDNGKDEIIHTLELIKKLEVQESLAV